MMSVYVTRTIESFEFGVEIAHLLPVSVAEREPHSMSFGHKIAIESGIKLVTVFATGFATSQELLSHSLRLCADA